MKFLLSKHDRYQKVNIAWRPWRAHCRPITYEISVKRVTQRRVMTIEASLMRIKWKSSLLEQKASVLWPLRRSGTILINVNASGEALPRRRINGIKLFK